MQQIDSATRLKTATLRKITNKSKALESEF